MSKLTKLYHIILTNVRSIFLFVIVFSFYLDVGGQNFSNNKLRTIVIDPGHGGHDPGNLGTGRYEKTEKHIALAISLKVGEYVRQNFPDINVIYTRNTNEEFLKLGERTQLANDNNADLFMSIHCDAFTSPDASGAGVYVMGMSKLKANMDIAMKENSVIYLEDDYQENYEGFDPNSPESYIVFSLTQNTFLDQSLNIAQEISDCFQTCINRKSRGVKQAPFYVISRANMPAILVECGFLTNPNEEDFLHSEKGQDHLALAIFRAFKAYRESLEDIDLLEEQSPVSALNENNSKEKKNPHIKKVKAVFKVQIGSYLKSMKNEKSFLELEAKEQILNGVFKYYVGSENNKDNADKIKEEMRNLGFEDAFVVAFYKDQRISIQEALDLQTKIMNNE